MILRVKYSEKGGRMSSWKMIELTYPDGHPRKEHMSAFMPVALSDWAPFGALSLEEAKEIAARQFGLVGDDFVLRLASACRGEDRVHEAYFNGGKDSILVRTTKKDIIGDVISTSLLYMLIRHEQAAERQVWEAGGKQGEEPVNAVTELAHKNLEGYRSHPGVPIVIWDPKLFIQLWPNAHRHDGESVRTGPVVLYLQRYRDYGTCIWPLDAYWEVSPFNGDRPATNSGMSIAQQLVLTLAAFTVLSNISLDREYPLDARSDSRKLVELAPSSYYFTRVLGSDNHDNKVTALQQLLEIVEEVEPMRMLASPRAVRASIRLAIIDELCDTFGFGERCDHARSVWRKRVAGLQKYPEFLNLFHKLVEQPAKASA